MLALIVGAAVLIIGSAPELLRVLKQRARRRRTWSARALRRLERVGGKHRRPRAPAEGPREYAHALAIALDEPALEQVGDTIDRDAFAAVGASPTARDQADAILSNLRH
jgi:hypothetical protein